MRVALVLGSGGLAGTAFHGGLLTALAERGWGRGWRTAVAYRYATGRPFTPVAAAPHDPARARWVPTYGAPISQRLPAFHRLDATASYFRRFGASWQGVAFYSLSNALDRANVHAYRYTADYSARIPVRSIFNRSHYVGMSLTRS